MKNEKPKIVAIWFLWALISLVLKTVLNVIMFIYGLFAGVYYGKLYDYMQEIAECNDVAGNVVGRFVFNDICRKKSKIQNKMAYDFGDRRDTISYALARNKAVNNLNWFGKVIEWITCIFEKDHLKKTLETNRLYYQKRCKEYGN